ncbi:MAG TPA: hypothetical protein VGR12_08130, partial [Solirubrobacteraceae bacterium]|nr:hypothetical protein [Solirubrobacteraceae bacterium]
GSLRRRALAPALVVVVAALTVAPWTIRNAIVMDRFIPVSTQTGYTLAGTYNEVTPRNPVYPGAWIDPRLFARELGPGFGGRYAEIFAQDLGEAELDERLRRAAIRYIRRHPELVPRVVFENARRAFGLRGVEWERLTDAAVGVAPRPAKASAYGFIAFGVLALAGAVTRRGRRLPPLLWIGALLLALSFLVAQGEPRFRVPLDPLVILLAGIALAALATRASRMSRPRSARP